MDRGIRDRRILGRGIPDFRRLDFRRLGRGILDSGILDRRRRRSLDCRLARYAFVLLLFAPSLSFALERLPVPDRAVVQRHERRVRQAFADSYADKTRDGRERLANRLLKAAGDSAEASVRYVYLKESIDMAVLAGETKMALQTLDRLAGGFEVDSLALQLETLQALQKTVKLAEDRLELSRRALKLLPRAVAIEDYERAAQMSALVASIAKPLKNVSQFRRATFFRRQYTRLAKEHVAVRKAAKALLEAPDLVPQNARLAMYYGLYRCDLRRAMPHLERSDDELYVELIALDRGKPESAEERLQLAERWWRLANDDRFFKSERKHFPYRWHFLTREFQRQALRWYTLALPQLQGVQSVEVENRVENWGKVAHSEIAGNEGGDSFESVRSERGLLVGFRYSIDEEDNEIASMKPMFQTPYGEELGRKHRGVSRGATDVVAKPGYAVGGLVVKADRRIHGFQVIFMRVDGIGLDLKDRYESPWYGGNPDIEASTLGVTGEAVVGFVGTAQSKIYSIGLALKP